MLCKSIKIFNCGIYFSKIGSLYLLDYLFFCKRIITMGKNVSIVLI